jgi:hypothetical protein
LAGTIRLKRCSKWDALKGDPICGNCPDWSTCTVFQVVDLRSLPPPTERPPVSRNREESVHDPTSCPGGGIAMVKRMPDGRPSWICTRCGAIIFDLSRKKGEARWENREWIGYGRKRENLQTWRRLGKPIPLGKLPRKKRFGELMRKEKREILKKRKGEIPADEVIIDAELEELGSRKLTPKEKRKVVAPVTKADREKVEAFCLYCGKPFVPERRDQRYCKGPWCRSAYNMRKKRLGKGRKGG